MVYTQPGNRPGEWDTTFFEILRYKAKRPDLVIIDIKKNLANSGQCHPGRAQREHERKRKERQVLKPYWKIRKSNGTRKWCCNGCARDDPQNLSKRAARIRNRRTITDHSNYSIKIGQNTEKSPGDLRRLAAKVSTLLSRRINLKECEKKDKYLDLATELKKPWNMKVTFVPIVIGAFGTITKGLLKGLEELGVGGRVETIKMTALLRTARILRRMLEIWGDSQSLKLQWKTIS